MFMAHSDVICYMKPVFSYLFLMFQANEVTPKLSFMFSAPYNFRTLYESRHMQAKLFANKALRYTVAIININKT